MFYPQCTTFDLLEKGMEVHIVVDAVSSRRYLDSFICSIASISPALHLNMFLCVSGNGIGMRVWLFVSLHSQTDRLFALSRLKQSGAYLTTTEAVLLQLVQDAKHPNFKEVLTEPQLLLFVSMCHKHTSPAVYPPTAVKTSWCSDGTSFTCKAAILTSDSAASISYKSDNHVFFINRSRGFWPTRPPTPTSSASSALCRQIITCPSVPDILCRMSLLPNN